MVQVYNILDSIRDHFRNNGITNTVSYGDVEKVDLDKTTIFPMAHFDLASARYDNNVIVFRIKLIVLDLIDVNKNEENVDEFFGNDNLHDVMNTQFVAITKFINSLRMGSLYNDGFRLDEEPEVNPFEDRFENMLAGWFSEIDIQIKNDISGC